MSEELKPCLADVCLAMAKDICERLVGKQFSEADAAKIGEFIYRCSTAGALAWAVLQESAPVNTSAEPVNNTMESEHVGEGWQPTRDEIGRAMQNIFSRFWPDDYEESWPVKAMYAVADAMLDGSFDKMIAARRAALPKEPRHG